MWKEFVRNHCQGRVGSYILMDEFKVHMMGVCVRELGNLGTAIDYVPGGYTSKLQMLDVGVMKPFKDFMTQEYEKFMVGNTDGHNVKRLDVENWVDRSWSRITEETIFNTWATIGYNNNNL